MKKKLIPCIYLKNKMVVKSFFDSTIIDTNPVKLCKTFSENSADEILVFDLSSGDQEHEEALDVIKEMCASATVPVIGAGNVKRMEDIKKLLYAGCKKACLNFSKEENISICKEVSEKFGKDKIAACIFSEDGISENKTLLDKYVSSVVLLNEQAFNEDYISENFSFIVMLPTVSLDKMIDYLKKKCSNVIVVNAEEICREAGSSKVFNVAILGVAVGTGKTGLLKENVIEEIRSRVKEKFIDINMIAFSRGEQIGAEYEIK